MAPPFAVCKDSRKLCSFGGKRIIVNGSCLVAVLLELLTVLSCFLMYAERRKGNNFTVYFVFWFELLT
jgi:hypothetical protein